MRDGVVSTVVNKHADPGNDGISPELVRGSLRLAIVGAGALGSEVCVRLAEEADRDALTLQKIAEVIIIDPDRLEAKNIALTRLYSAVDTGRLKAELAAELLGGGAFPRWTGLPAEIADVGWQVLHECDLLVSCVDSALARVEIALVSRRLGVPMLDGGIAADGLPAGRVSWYPSRTEAACYFCGIGAVRRAELLAYGVARTLGCSRLEEPEPMSDLPTVTPAVRETAARIVRSILHFAWSGETGCLEPGRASAERLMARDVRGQEWATERVSLPRSVGCPWHEENPGMLVVLDERKLFRQSMPQVSGAETPWRIQFAWPVCVEARCRACGLRQHCAERLAKLRRRGVCAGCGVSGSLEPLRSIGSLGADDQDAGKTPSQLGLPSRHLYSIRRTGAIMSAGGNQS